MDPIEPVNLKKSVLLCNLYNFFFAASKACLFPFLTLYLRFLGLTGTEVGIVIGCKTTVALCFAPLWTQCAIRCRKRRLAFMFSIFMMAATYLSLTVIPNKNFNPKTCSKSTKDKESLVIHPLPTVNFHKSTLSPVTQFLNVTDNNKIIHSNHTYANDTIGSLHNVKTTDQLMKTPVPTSAGRYLTAVELETTKEILQKLGLSEEEVISLDEQEVINVYNTILLDQSTQKLLLKNLSHEQAMVLKKLIDILLSNSHQGRALVKAEIKHRKKRDLAEKLQNALNQQHSFTLIERIRRDLNLTHYKEVILQSIAKMKSQLLKSAKDYTFMAVMITLIIGEIFCCPVEKLADDFWFEFLDKIDELESYGKHRVWCSFAYMLFPLLLTLIVDHTDCVMNYTMPGMMLHFYIFSAFLALTFLLAFFYPITKADKSQYKSKVIRGIGATLCRLDGFLYTFTLCLIGVTYAAYYNFLFWIIGDLKGPETIMGLCVTITALVELPMLLFSHSIISRVGHSGVVCVAMVTLALKMLYYSYLWTPWAVLPAELLHAVTHTALWCAVLSHPRFNMSPAVDRSIRSILSSAYFGIGFAIGSIVAGVLYDRYGYDIVFQACSVLVVVWCPFFFLLNRCCRRPVERDIKYTKLLQADGQESDDDEDDWLDSALHHYS